MKNFLLILAMFTGFCLAYNNGGNCKQITKKGVTYDICYNSYYDTFDTSFAVTEFQRAPGDKGGWRFYRKNGTLKFEGSEKGGYCMSADGMKQTKQVISPEYCK